MPDGPHTLPEYPTPREGAITRGTRATRPHTWGALSRHPAPVSVILAAGKRTPPGAVQHGHTTPTGSHLARGRPMWPCGLGPMGMPPPARPPYPPESWAAPTFPVSVCNVMIGCITVALGCPHGAAPQGPSGYFFSFLPSLPTIPSPDFCTPDAPPLLPCGTLCQRTNLSRTKYIDTPPHRPEPHRAASWVPHRG